MVPDPQVPDAICQLPSARCQMPANTKTTRTRLRLPSTVTFFSHRRAILVSRNAVSPRRLSSSINGVPSPTELIISHLSIAMPTLGDFCFSFRADIERGTGRQQRSANTTQEAFCLVPGSHQAGTMTRPDCLGSPRFLMIDRPRHGLHLTTSTRTEHGHQLNLAETTSVLPPPLSICICERSQYHRD